MSNQTHALKAEIAYRLWDSAGRADGHDLEHWFRAEEIVNDARSSTDEEDDVNKKRLKSYFSKTVRRAEPEAEVDRAAALRAATTSEEPAVQPALEAAAPSPAPPVAPIDISQTYGFNAAEQRTWMVDETGLGRREPNHRWTVGPRASLAFYLPEACPEHASITLAFQGFVRPEASSVDADVVINGVHVGMMHYDVGAATRRREASVNVPTDALGALRRLTLELYVHDPRSPKALGVNQDDRELGFALLSLTVRPERVAV